MGGNHSSKSYWVSLDEGSMRRGVSFHVYKGDEVVAHNLSVSELENFLVNHVGDLSIHEILPVEDAEYDDASF